jgi:hypothetical protein
MLVDAFEKKKEILDATQLATARIREQSTLIEASRGKYKTGDFTTEPKQ